VSIPRYCAPYAGGRKTSGTNCVASRPPDYVRMIASLESETPQNAERGIETGIPFEVDSRNSNEKRLRQATSWIVSHAPRVLAPRFFAAPDFAVPSR